MKRIEKSIFLCVFAFLVPVPAGAIVAGDVNGDTSVTAVDVQLVINGALGIDIAPLNADVDLTGSTDAVDVQLIVNAALGLTIDSDGEGLPDVAERALGTNQDLVDTDDDGLDDYVEVLAGLNPLVPDSVVVINEFVASNDGGLRDEDGELTDWVEIYNPGSGSINLDGWGLTDDAGDSLKWTFPDITMAPGAYLVVFASAKNRRPVNGDNLHTNFSLSKEGDYLALVTPTGVALPTSFSEPQYPAQQADIAYGLYGGDPGYWYLVPPTPGASNESSVKYVAPSTEPAFSQERGFYEAAFGLRLSTDTPGGEIYYTTDGSAPTESSGTRYRSSISITTTTAVRAIVIAPDHLPSRTTTHTYVFLADVIRQPEQPEGFPDVWHRGYPVNYVMRQDVVAEYSDEIIDDLMALPTMSLVMDVDDLFSQESGIYSNSEARGVEWERPASVEYFFPDGTEGFDVNCGIRVYGDGSAIPSVNLKHTLRLLFKSQYGPSKLRYPLFENSPIEEFDTLILRGSSNFSWVHLSDGLEWQRENALYIRDVFARDTQLAMGHPSSHGNYVHLYLNGLYWGLYNPSERPSATFLADHLGGSKEEWDALNTGQPIDGDRDSWNTMMSMANAGMNSEEDYEAIQRYLNIENLIDYDILNHYLQNGDWPMYNWYAGRRRQEGAGYHFFAWDSEYAVYDVDANIVSRNPDDTAQRLLHALRDHPEFEMLFADHVHRHLFNDGTLTPSATIARWMMRADELFAPIVGESARWGDSWMRVHDNLPYTRDGDWIPALDWVIEEFLPVRPGVLLDQYRDIGLYPSVEAPVFYVNGAYQHGGRVADGDTLSMENPSGSGAIYYTADGIDPRLPALLAERVSSTTLVEESAPKRVSIPTATTPVGTAWREDAGFDDSGWTNYTFVEGRTGGVGYELESGFEDHLSYDIEEQMFGTNASCYIRIPFSAPAGVSTLGTQLTLRLRVDDGFVAYIDGVRVASKYAPSPLQWNSSSTGGDEDSTDFEEYDISSFMDQLVEGDHVLAIHGLNASADESSDYLISAELVVEEFDGAAGGGISPSALLYEGSLEIADTIVIHSRVYYGNEWSALNVATFVIDGIGDSLHITEINYNPADGGAEFIEVGNRGSRSIDLTGVYFSEGIRFDFEAQSVLAPGQRAVLVRDNDVDAFQERYPDVVPRGYYAGRLDNGGETVALSDASGAVVTSVTYDDLAPWPVEADGFGHSLVLTNAGGDPNDPANWGTRER
jgi:hypothetical protein